MKKFIIPVVLVVIILTGAFLYYESLHAPQISTPASTSSTIEQRVSAIETYLNAAVATGIFPSGSQIYEAAKQKGLVATSTP